MIQGRTGGQGIDKAAVADGAVTTAYNGAVERGEGRTEGRHRCRTDLAGEYLIGGCESDVVTIIVCSGFGGYVGTGMIGGAGCKFRQADGETVGG